MRPASPCARRSPAPPKASGEKAETVLKGTQALNDASAAIDRARAARTAMDSDPELQMGAAPTAFQPDPDKTPAENKTARGLHAGQVTAYWDAYNRREAESQRIADQLDRDLVDAGRKMQEIHGEPDPVEEKDSRTPAGGGGSGGGAGGGGRAPYAPTNPGTSGTPGVYEQTADSGQTDTPVDRRRRVRRVVLDHARPDRSGADQPDAHRAVPAADGSAPVSSGGISPTAGGIAAGGLGAAGLGNLLRGGLPGSGQAVRAGSARPIGSTSRAAASGALGRGSSAPAAGSTARSGAAGAGGRAGAAGQSTAKQGSGARSGGTRGAAARAAGGRGAGAGAGGRAAGAAAGGRGRGSKDDEKQGQARDLFDDGQDWIDDDDAVDGVLD